MQWARRSAISSTAISTEINDLLSAEANVGVKMNIYRGKVDSMKETCCDLMRDFEERIHKQLASKFQAK